MINASDIFHGKIRIVDDLGANVLLLERMLRGAGYACIESTTDSTRVCAPHLEKHYDLILLDLQMPGMDGFRVMEKPRAIEPEDYIPVLVITAQPDHKLRALHAGADHEYLRYLRCPAQQAARPEAVTKRGIELDGINPATKKRHPDHDQLNRHSQRKNPDC